LAKKTYQRAPSRPEGVTRAVAMPTETLFPSQLARLRSLVGDGGRIDFAPWTKEY
jgi:hypothetical protein